MGVEIALRINPFTVYAQFHMCTLKLWHLKHSKRPQIQIERSISVGVAHAKNWNIGAEQKHVRSADLDFIHIRCE